LKVQLQVLEARVPSDLVPAFSTMTKTRTGGFTILAASIFFAERTRIAELAIQSLLPSISRVREFAEAGGLMAYGPSLPDSLRRAATYVDHILKSAKPGDLPIEQATKFELVINLKTAKALGLTIPPSLMARADQVIE
jgi:putative tryptophan/tyrosine transport system substrate-binding protein